jgi:hypothetical protein
MKDIDKLINHAEIQNTLVLSKVLDVSSQQINKWRNRGISKKGRELIDSNSVLKGLDSTNLIKKSVVKKNQIKAINFIENLDLHNVASKTGVSLMCLFVYKARGAVTMSLARKLRDEMGIPVSESRPDIPQLAFDLGINNWVTPKKQKQYGKKSN